MVYFDDASPKKFSEKGDIQEGIAELIKIHICNDYRLDCDRIAKNVIRYLDSEGVVKVVERELTIDDIGWLSGEGGIIRSVWIKEGSNFVGVERLI